MKKKLYKTKFNEAVSDKKNLEYKTESELLLQNAALGLGLIILTF